MNLPPDFLERCRQQNLNIKERINSQVNSVIDDIFTFFITEISNNNNDPNNNLARPFTTTPTTLISPDLGFCDPSEANETFTVPKNEPGKELLIFNLNDRVTTADQDNQSSSGTSSEPIDEQSSTPVISSQTQGNDSLTI